MTLETIYYIGQTIAVLAILISLVMIVIEQRRKNEADKGVTLMDLAKQLSEFSWRYTQDQELLEVIRVCLNTPDQTDRNQKARFHGYMMNLMELADQAYYQKKYQLSTAEAADDLAKYVAANFKTPGGLEWWNTVGAVMWSDEMTAHLQALIDKDDGSVPIITDILDHLRLERNVSQPKIEPLKTPETAP